MKKDYCKFLAALLLLSAAGIAIFAALDVAFVGIWLVFASWLRVDYWISAIVGGVFVAVYTRAVPLWHFEVRS